jgi:hypothetical protein
MVDRGVSLPEKIIFPLKKGLGITSLGDQGMVVIGINRLILYIMMMKWF